ncbi:hypothetical protein Tco_0153620 [Tanacetum coccineum]
MKDLQHSFRNSNEYYHDPEKYEHAGPKVTTSQEGNTPQQGGLRDLLSEYALYVVLFLRFHLNVLGLVVVDEEIVRDNLTASMISNQWERFAEIERIWLAFRIMPVESFSCGLGTFFKMVL